MDSTDKTRLADDKTMVASRNPAQIHVCPACGTANAENELQRRDYLCSKCRLELAHLDYAPNGTVRGVFGWLHSTGDVVLDRYQIKSVLGKGGFGAAYLVDDLQLNGRHRALKEVPIPMFDEYETSLLSRLDHPGIPDIIDRRTVNGMVYLVLKFGGSRTLGDERKQYPDRRIPQEKLFPWMRQLCEVLIYLHSQNPPIIHRDLKPDNILLNEDQRIMLIDFGIAKEALDEGRTRTLAMAVTVGFSPPEQVMGTGTDIRTDVYALGATFYSLLTGQNPTAAHKRISGEELIPPSQLVPDVPPEVEQAIIQSLNLNMHHRQQSVREFAMALSGFDTTEFSRPIQTEEWAQRTVALSHDAEGGKSRATGLKLPTGKATTAHDLPSMRIPQGKQQRSLVLTLIGITIFLAVIATAIYYYFSQPPQPLEATQPGTTDVGPQPQATDQPVPQQVAPLPPGPAIQTEPSYPTRPTPVTPKVEGPSAQDMLKQRQVEPEPSPEPEPEPQPQPVRPKQVARPKRAVKPPPRTSSPQPSGQSQPTWVIIPGGARKTD